MDTSIIHLDDLFDVAQPPKEPDRYERWVNKLREMFCAQEGIIRDLEHEVNVLRGKLKKAKAQLQFGKAKKKAAV